MAAIAKEPGTRGRRPSRAEPNSSRGPRCAADWVHSGGAGSPDAAGGRSGRLATECRRNCSRASVQANAGPQLISKRVVVLAQDRCQSRPRVTSYRKPFNTKRRSQGLRSTAKTRGPIGAIVASTRRVGCTDQNREREETLIVSVSDDRSTRFETSSPFGTRPVPRSIARVSSCRTGST